MADPVIVENIIYRIAEETEGYLPDDPLAVLKMGIEAGLDYHE